MAGRKHRKTVFNLDQIIHLHFIRNCSKATRNLKIFTSCRGQFGSEATVFEGLIIDGHIVSQAAAFRAVKAAQKTFAIFSPLAPPTGGGGSVTFTALSKN